MNKTTITLDELASKARHDKETLLLSSDEKIIDLFIERYGGERCADDDGGTYIDYDGCKIYYKIIKKEDAQKFRSAPLHRIYYSPDFDDYLPMLSRKRQYKPDVVVVS